MESKPRPRFWPAVAVVLLTLLPELAAASTRPGRHHLSVTAGYARHLATIHSGFAYTGLPPDEADLDDALDAGLRYRVSLRPGFDLAFEAHRVQAKGTVVLHDFPGGSVPVRQSHRTDWWGVGLRRTLIAAGFRPFFQMGFVRARERDRYDDGDWYPGYSDFGVALAAGGEVPVSRALSVPIELGWMYAAPVNDVSTLGLRTGVTWHPGR